MPMLLEVPGLVVAEFKFVVFIFFGTPFFLVVVFQTDNTKKQNTARYCSRSPCSHLTLPAGGVVCLG